MFSDSEDFSPGDDSLISRPHLDNIKRCTCCLSETCLVKENSTAAPAKSSSFLSAAGLKDDPILVKLEPMDLYQFAQPEQVLESPMEGSDVAVTQLEGENENEQTFETSSVEGEQGIKEVRVISLFKRPDHPLKPVVKTEDGERKKYARYREKQYICDVCDRSFTLKQNIAQHFYQYHHPRIASKQRALKEVLSRFCCTKCDKVFTDFEKAKRHEQRAHGDPPKKVVHACDRCERTFPSPHLLVEHISVVHEQLKPFKCEKCDQTFGRQGGLRRHQMMVHDNKTFMCPYEDCDHPGYKCSKALAAHIRSQHTHERPFGCMYCERCFVRKNDLKVHELTHSGDAIFHCDNCGADFKRESYLRKHRMHCGLEIKEIKKKPSPPSKKHKAKKNKKKA